MNVQMETDGAARGNPGPAAGAAVLYDAQGRLLLRVGVFLGTATNNVAEYTGLLAGLREAEALGATELVIRADSELMVRQLNGRYQVRSPLLLPLYREAMHRLARFRRVQIQHVPRERNRAADRAANDAVDREASFREVPTSGDGAVSQGDGSRPLV